MLYGVYLDSSFKAVEKFLEHFVNKFYLDSNKEESKMIYLFLYEIFSNILKYELNINTQIIDSKKIIKKSLSNNLPKSKIYILLKPESKILHIKLFFKSKKNNFNLDKYRYVKRINSNGLGNKIIKFYTPFLCYKAPNIKRSKNLNYLEVNLKRFIKEIK